jgi:hypothetical protein
LRNRTIPQREVARRKQHIGASLADKLGQSALLKPETRRNAARRFLFDDRDLAEVCQLGAKSRAEKHGHSNIVARRKLRQDIADVGEAASRAGREGIDK